MAHFLPTSLSCLPIIMMTHRRQFMSVQMAACSMPSMTPSLSQMMVMNCLPMFLARCTGNSKS